MAWTKGTFTATSGSLTTGFTLVINAGVQANDLLIVGITNRDATTNPTCVDNEGAGTWTRITTVNATTNGSISFWWKRASANTASKTITVGSCTGSASGVVMPYRGGSIAASPFGTPVGEGNASGNELQAGITTARDGSMVIHLVGCTSNDTLAPGNRTATSPTTITEDAEGVSSGGSDCSLSIASDIKASAGATGDISWAQTDGTGASLAIEMFLLIAPLTAAAGSYAIAGTDATLKTARRVTADSGSVAVTGTTATLSRGFNLAVDPGSYAITGTAAGLRATRTLAASSGSVAATGTAATLTAQRLISASAGSVAITGTAATLTYEESNGTTLTADPGSVIINGTAATLSAARLVSATSGSATATGTNAGLVATRLLSASSSIFAITGTDAGFTRGRQVTASAGSVSVTGTASGLRVARLLDANTGAVAIVGTNATLTGPGQTHYTITAATGSLALDGTDSALARGYLVDSEDGAIWITGSIATLTKYHPPPTPRKHQRMFGRPRAIGGFPRLRRMQRTRR